MLLLCWWFTAVYFFFILKIGKNSVGINNYHEFVESDCDDTHMINYGYGSFADQMCIKKQSYFFQVLIIFYFCFTTLSTVGLGDFHPRGDAERLLVVPFLIFGVMSLSLITERFLTIVGRLKSINQDFGDQARLE